MRIHPLCLLPTLVCVLEIGGETEDRNNYGCKYDATMMWLETNFHNYGIHQKP